MLFADCFYSILETERVMRIQQIVSDALKRKKSKISLLEKIGDNKPDNMTKVKTLGQKLN